MSGPQRKRSCNDLKAIVKRYDIFGQPVSFNFSEDSSDYKSLAGFFLTCAVFTITILFTVQNIIILRERDGTLITTAVKANYNDENRIFTEEDGFQIAIAVGDSRTFPNFTDPFGREIHEYLEIVVT